MVAIQQKKAPKKYLHIKHRIRAIQNRAKWAGTLYVLALLAIFVLACLQPITFDGGAIGVLEFWKPFALLTEGDFVTALLDNAISITVALLYSIMLLVLLISFISALCSMGWLYKKKASKLYGFNRNMYAMDDIEKCYSASLKTVICVFVMITGLSVPVQVNLVLVGAILGVGVFFHFLCGLLAGHASLFTVDGEITEEKRKVGTFSVFVRNLLQIAATVGFVYFFLQSSGTIAVFIKILVGGGFEELLNAPVELAWVVVRLLLFVFTLIMIGYAFGTTEFAPEGKNAGGRGTFLWTSLFACIVALSAAIFYAVYYEIALDKALMFMAGIALVAFVLEVLLKNFPKETKRVNPDDVDENEYLRNGVTEDDEEFVMQPQLLPPMYYPMLPYGQPMPYQKPAQYGQPLRYEEGDYDYDEHFNRDEYFDHDEDFDL